MNFLLRKRHQEVVVYATFERWVKREKPDRQGNNTPRRAKPPPFAVKRIKPDR